VCGDEAMGMMHVGDIYTEPTAEQPMESLQWGAALEGTADNLDAFAGELLGSDGDNDDMPDWLHDEM
jgi:hypothetical protein